MKTRCRNRRYIRKLGHIRDLIEKRHSISLGQVREDDGSGLHRLPISNSLQIAIVVEVLAMLKGTHGAAHELGVCLDRKARKLPKGLDNTYRRKDSQGIIQAQRTKYVASHEQSKAAGEHGEREEREHDRIEIRHLPDARRLHACI